MNLNMVMRKLQRAILQKGLVIKIGSTQFYSKEQNTPKEELISKTEYAYAISAMQNNTREKSNTQ